MDCGEAVRLNFFYRTHDVQKRKKERGSYKAVLLLAGDPFFLSSGISTRITTTEITVPITRGSR